MRAIIRIRTNVADERLDDILKTHGWLPRFTNEALLHKRREEILDTIHQDDVEVVRETLLNYTLLDDPTKTWGIVNRPVDNLITVRLKNPIPDRLKAATEKLVSDLQSVTEKEKTLSFEFSRIEVLEPGGYIHAFSGTVLPRNRFGLATTRRRTEWVVGGAAFLTALLLLMVTIPPIRHAILRLGTDWTTWIQGFLERLATSALVTATVSWLNVFLYYFELKRLATIVWEA